MTDTGLTDLTDRTALTEDYCRCGHVASAHVDGDGECGPCKASTRRTWIQLSRCYQFTWAETWEPVRERRSA